MARSGQHGGVQAALRVERAVRQRRRQAEVHDSLDHGVRHRHAERQAADAARRDRRGPGDGQPGPVAVHGQRVVDRAGEHDARVRHLVGEVERRAGDRIGVRSAACRKGVQQPGGVDVRVTQPAIRHRERDAVTAVHAVVVALVRRDVGPHLSPVRRGHVRRRLIRGPGRAAVQRAAHVDVRSAEAAGRRVAPVVPHGVGDAIRRHRHLGQPVVVVGRVVVDADRRAPGDAVRRGHHHHVAGVTSDVDPRGVQARADPIAAGAGRVLHAEVVGVVSGQVHTIRAWTFVHDDEEPSLLRARRDTTVVSFGQ